MLATLLLKDLRRARRNPVPYLIHLCLPLVITALLGLVFSGANRGGGGGLGRIKLAVVDEDASPLTSLLRGAMNQRQAGEHLELSFLSRSNALALLTDNAISAALVIPTGFTRGYLTGDQPVTLELIKNPAQQYYPAIIEELLGAATTALNAVARNFSADLDDWRPLLRGEQAWRWNDVGERLLRTGERFELRRQRLDPLPVYYDRETRPRASTESAGGRQGVNVFAVVLPGLAAMFLLFLADLAMRDLHRERERGTFARLSTLPVAPAWFLLSKLTFTFVILALAATILLGGGMLAFGIRWTHPLAVIALAAGLALFAGGLMAVLNGLMPGERQADVLNSVVGMTLGLASGCAFPAPALPTFLREHITPWLPPHWFVEGMRQAQFTDNPGPWALTATQLAALGVLLTFLAAWLLKRRLQR